MSDTDKPKANGTKEDHATYIRQQIGKTQKNYAAQRVAFIQSFQEIEEDQPVNELLEKGNLAVFLGLESKADWLRQIATEGEALLGSLKDLQARMTTRVLDAYNLTARLI